MYTIIFFSIFRLVHYRKQEYYKSEIIHHMDINGCHNYVNHIGPDI